MRRNSETLQSDLIATKHLTLTGQCIPGTASTTLTTSAKPTTSTAKPTTSSAAPTSAPAPSNGIKYLISFGDSYSQTGWTTSGAQASPQNPIGNPPFPGWTTSGGPNWLGFYITQYNKSVTYSYNFAYGGATTDASLATPYDPSVLSFIDQTSDFSASLAKKPSYAPWTSTNALFAIWMGVNDVGMDWSMSNWSSLVEQIMTRYFQQVQIMYNAGGRKFLFLTVPPIQRTPNLGQYGEPTDSNIKAAIGLYNDALKSHAASFKAANSGVTTYILDTTTSFNTALDNPKVYGAPDNTCYESTGTKCLWFNDVSFSCLYPPRRDPFY
ncbi:MAG: hypothetical protein Q9160_008187 [Pyrenula sp. 1 TL-2023]